MDLVGSDAVTLSGVGTYANKNVTGAADKTYTFTSLALSGADSANYVLTEIDLVTPTTSYTASNGNITPRTLDVTYTGVNKVYDADITASVTTTDNREVGDDFLKNMTARIADKKVA